MIDSFGKIKNATKLVAFFICIAILLLAQRSNAYIRFTFAFFAEGNRAVNQCEERVILADTYVLARIVDSTSLANDDVASFSELTTEKFDAESLAFRLAAVLRTTYTFFVCHVSLNLRLCDNFFHENLAQELTVSVLLLIACSAFLLEHEDFVVL